MNQFSVKKYLIDNKLVSEEGELISQPKSNIGATWGIGPQDKYKTMIYLVTLVHFFEEYGALDNLSIWLEYKGDIFYTIFINEIDRKDDSANFRWDLIIDTIDFLLPNMAGSNISYLADMLFVNN